MQSPLSGSGADRSRRIIPDGTRRKEPSSMSELRGETRAEIYQEKGVSGYVYL